MKRTCFKRPILLLYYNDVKTATKCRWVKVEEFAHFYIYYKKYKLNVTKESNAAAVQHVFDIIGLLLDLLRAYIQPRTRFVPCVSIHSELYEFIVYDMFCAYAGAIVIVDESIWATGRLDYRYSGYLCWCMD